MKEDPEDWAGWQVVLKKMRTHEFVSYHEARRPEFQLRLYPAHEYDDQIYHDIKKRKTQMKGPLHVERSGKSYPDKHCMKCGRNNHSTAECRASYRCSICDRIGHGEKSCWRNEDNKGSYRGNNRNKRKNPSSFTPPSKRRKFNNDNRSNNNRKQHQNNRGKNDGKCFRCGRDNHKKAKCFATKHIDGHSLDPSSAAKKPNNGDRVNKGWNGSGGGQRYNPANQPTKKEDVVEATMVIETPQQRPRQGIRR